MLCCAEQLGFFGYGVRWHTRIRVFHTVQAVANAVIGLYKLKSSQIATSAPTLFPTNVPTSSAASLHAATFALAVAVALCAF
jgi:hypothetical protein